MNNKFATIETVLVGAIMCMLAILIMSGCGGDDSNDNEIERQQLPSNTTCAHDGDIWICDEQNSCVRDESSIVEETEVVDDMARMNYFARDLTTGNITIISECGSNVTFNITSNDDEQTAE